MRLLRCRSGNVAVEFALLLTPVLMIVFGFIEFGRFFYLQDALANAAREGARWATVRGKASDDPATAQEIAAYVTERSPSIALPTVEVSFEPSNAPGGKVTVQVRYPFEPVVPGLNLLGSFMIDKTSSMTISR